MELITYILKLTSYLLFIGISYQLLMTLFDWHKVIHQRPENSGKLKLFLFFIAIVIGYVVSNFMLELIQMSQSLFFMLR
ncbi:DUF1146 family protein [Streptococcus ictaluri]|uniref:Membrane protein n=1 Tax=Streptococcus ictaluri 707-05 TaxID=764299 RepID=G5K3Z1_9STRE|nr:DUF1146 family protein [Streptococcus ictaluri]EHI69929.1 putative membrane protein [Streptococcus ictaluri 707-05]